MSTTSAVRIKAVTDKLGPGDADETARTLWRARLRVQNNKDEFLFRSSEDFTDAAEVAQQLLDESPSCKMVGPIGHRRDHQGARHD